MSVMYAARIAPASHLQPLPSAAFDFGSGDFTLVASFLTTSGGAVIGCHAPDDPGYVVVVDPDGSIRFATFGSTGFYQVVSGTTAALDGQNHTLAAVRTGADLAIHLDGKQLDVTSFGNATPPVDVSNDLPLTIGCVADPTEPRAQFLGDLMNVGAWDVALSGDALVSASFGRVAASDPGLQGYWNLDNSTDDLSPNDNPANIVGPITFAPCICCVWTAGTNDLVFCQMTNAPSPDALVAEMADLPLDISQTIAVPVGVPALAVAIMADGDTPAYPQGVGLEITDPSGNRYDTITNTADLLVVTNGADPWALMAIGPEAGSWTVRVTAPASVAFALQVQTVPTGDVVATTEAALEPLYGDPSRCRELEHLSLGGWLSGLAKIAVAAVVGVAVAAVVVFSGGAALPAVVAGLVAFTGVSIVETALTLPSLDTGSLDGAGTQIGGMGGFIVSPDTVLLIDANVSADPATELMYKRRSKKLYPYVTASPFNDKQHSLVAARDTRANVSAQLSAFQAGYVTAGGHGLPSYLTGWFRDQPDGPLQEVLWVGHYGPAEAKGKIFHLYACSCGYRSPSGLGQDLINNGAIAFFGYSDKVAIMRSEYLTFCDCDIEIDLALIDGSTCDDAYQRAVVKYQAAISRFRADGNYAAATALEGNLNILVAPNVDRAYGNPNARLDRGSNA